MNLGFTGGLPDLLESRVKPISELGQYAKTAAVLLADSADNHKQMWKTAQVAGFRHLFPVNVTGHT
jgi:hypothetical protein